VPGAPDLNKPSTSKGEKRKTTGHEAQALASHIVTATTPQIGRASFREQLTMRTHADEPQSCFIWEHVYQQQVWLQMAFPMALPIPAQSMITVLFRERYVVHQSVGNP
jgi:hypothetical protein